MMTYRDFANDQQLLLFFGAGSIFLALILFSRYRRWSLICLGIGSVFLGVFAATLDPFLNLWDEQYHALVAKNMATDPWKPMLYKETLLPYDYTVWTINHIWLHKQPLFLWQMALSIKLFGVSEWAVRIPSVLMHAAMLIFVYRIGKIAVAERVGIIGAVFFTLAYYPLELIAGRYPTDHNDMAFLFYVTASFWSWFEYKASGKRIWLLWIGLFSGGAVLVKWLMGLLVFVVWLGTLVLDKTSRKSRASYIQLFSSGLIAAAVFLPWQVYTFLRFPIEAKFELKYNGEHLFTPIEGHAEHFWYYFQEGFSEMYGSGELNPILIIIGLLFFLRKINDRTIRRFVGIVVPFVYVFFTLAQTKMPSFPLIVAPFLFLGLATLVHVFLEFLERKSVPKILGKIVFVSLSLGIGIALMDVQRIAYHHADHPANGRRIMKAEEQRIIRSIEEVSRQDKTVVFNVNTSPNGHIAIMFYTDCVAYQGLPTPDQMKRISAQGWKMVVLESSELPDYLLENPAIQILPSVDWRERFN